MDKLLSLILHVLVIFLAFTRPCSSSNPASNAGFSGMFVFGDSTVANSNDNNLVSTTKKAKHLPYGIDFPLGPTGRFTNGKTLADRVGDLLKLPLLPSFTDIRLKSMKISKGVNHGYVDSGILDSTGSNMGVISLSKQVQNFLKVTLPTLESQQRRSRSRLLPQYLMLFSTGSNDFLLNFFQGGGNYATLESFTENMTSTLATQITSLYNAGARKFAFVNIGAIGCTPLARAKTQENVCNGTLNYVAYRYNTKLLEKLNAIKPKLPGFEFVGISFFQINLELTQVPSRGGFTDVSNSCCEVSNLSATSVCKEGGKVCSNRNAYLYFDGLHPSEALYGVVAARAYNSTDQSEVFPVNLQKLAQI